MIRLLHAPIRASAFLGKEIFTILRQPRLILTLALGPFLILALFGLGFRNDGRTFRALFVVPTTSPLAQQVQAFGSSLGPQLIFLGVTDDDEAEPVSPRPSDIRARVSSLHVPPAQPALEEAAGAE